MVGNAGGPESPKGARHSGRADGVGVGVGHVRGIEGLNARLRRVVLERTQRLLELDAILKERGEPGVLQRTEDELAELEIQELGPSIPDPPGPDAVTDEERRDWVRTNLRLIRGGQA